MWEPTHQTTEQANERASERPTDRPTHPPTHPPTNPPTKRSPFDRPSNVPEGFSSSISAFAASSRWLQALQLLASTCRPTLRPAEGVGRLRNLPFEGNPREIRRDMVLRVRGNPPKQPGNVQQQESGQYKDSCLCRK